MKPVFTYVIYGVLGMFLCSCNNNRLNVDISNIRIDPVIIQRMEKDLFTLNPDSLKQGSEKMLNKYGVFYIQFIGNFINKGSITDSAYLYNLNRFITDADMRGAWQETEKVFPEKSIQIVENNLTYAFKHYRYHFPDKKIPKVISCITGFNYSVIPADSILAISLDMFLGTNNKYYRGIGFPAYKSSRMDPDYLVNDALKGWMQTEFEPKELKNDFLSQIINEGKTLYLLDAVLPGTADSIKIGYTYQQMAWAKQNEFNVWTYLMEKKLIYTTDGQEIMKFITEAPFTSTFGRESPPRIGQWIGWQIVKAYMNKNDKVSLEELMKEEDAQKILTLSKYKPK